MVNFRMDMQEIQPPTPKKKKIARKKQLSIRGKRVVVTGALPGMTRRGVESWLLRYNARLQNTVNGLTDYVLTPNTRVSSIKATAARRRNIPIIKPEQVKEWKR